MGRVRFRHAPSGYTSETRYDARGRVTSEQTRGSWRYTSYAANVTCWF